MKLMKPHLKTHPCGSIKVKLLAERGFQNGDENLYSCKWLWVYVHRMTYRMSVIQLSLATLLAVSTCAKPMEIK